jgi:hypothetical protein
MRTTSPDSCTPEQRRAYTPARLLLGLLTGFAFAFASPAQADTDTLDVQGLMVISKMTGICGVLSQMVQFQETTKMPGGAEFIARFWNTEFARLDMPRETFLKNCKGSISAYDRLRETLETLEQPKNSKR